MAKFQNFRCRQIGLSLIVLAALVVSALPLKAWSASADDDDDASVVAPSADKAKRRLYPGGRDEQDLTVQANLPQPTRNPESQGEVIAPAVDDSAHD